MDNAACGQIKLDKKVWLDNIHVDGVNPGTVYEINMYVVKQSDTQYLVAQQIRDRGAVYSGIVLALDSEPASNFNN